MGKGITFVGIDAHKEMNSVAMLRAGDRVPVVWDFPNEPAAVRRLVRKLEREAPGEVRICYEAGPVGYALQRQIQARSTVGTSRRSRQRPGIGRFS
jgi:hypothetical protein